MPPNIHHLTGPKALAKIDKHVQNNCFCFLLLPPPSDWPLLNANLRTLSYGFIAIRREANAIPHAYLVLNHPIKYLPTKQAKQEVAQQFQAEMLYLVRQYKQHTLIIKNYAENDQYKIYALSSSGALIHTFQQAITSQYLAQYYERYTGDFLEENLFDMTEEYKYRPNNWLEVATRKALQEQIKQAGFYSYPWPFTIQRIPELDTRYRQK